MTTINIETLEKKFPDEDIMLLINYMLSKACVEYGDSAKFHTIATAIESITDPQLLKATVEGLKKYGYFSKKFNEPELGKYSLANQTKISAQLYALKLLLQYYYQLNEFLNSDLGGEMQKKRVLHAKLPSLKITLEGMLLKHNMDEIGSFLHKRSTNFTVDYANSKPLPEREEHLVKAILSMAELDYEYDTDFFDSDIKLLERLKTNALPEVKIVQEANAHVFKNDGFVLFEYIRKHFVTLKRGRSSDIAFFYWKMSQGEQYIHVRPEVFKRWYRETYNEPLEQLKTMDSLRKYSEVCRKRDINFGLALEWFNSKS